MKSTLLTTRTILLGGFFLSVFSGAYSGAYSTSESEKYTDYLRNPFSCILQNWMLEQNGSIHLTDLYDYRSDMSMTCVKTRPTLLSNNILNSAPTSSPALSSRNLLSATDIKKIVDLILHPILTTVASPTEHPINTLTSFSSTSNTPSIGTDTYINPGNTITTPPINSSTGTNNTSTGSGIQTNTGGTSTGSISTTGSTDTSGTGIPPTNATPNIPTIITSASYSIGTMSFSGNTDSGTTVKITNMSGDVLCTGIPTSTSYTCGPISPAIPEGIYFLRIEACNQGNLCAHHDFQIQVDTTSPVLTLIGSGSMSLSIGDTFIDPGASWTDNMDSSGTLLATSGSIDVYTPGVYTLEYSYIDTAKNKSDTLYRTIIIRDFSTLSPYTFLFPTRTALQKSQILSSIGNGSYTKIGDFYTNLSDVYTDFGLDPNMVMTCDSRHQTALDDPTSTGTFMKKGARNYFCLGEYDTDQCRAEQYKQVYLGYCLDKDDTLDWVAIQSAILRSNGKIVTIPSGKDFIVNQAIILPSNTHIVWEGQGISNNGPASHATNASYIHYQNLSEKLNTVNLVEPSRNIGFTVGSVLVNGDMPFVYSGSNIYPGYRVHEGIAEGIHLESPMIDVGNTIGENGISFALGASGNTIDGGVIKNIKISKQLAGGKAIQCEAGCRGLTISGVSIANAYIGINSNALAAYQKHNPFTDGGYVSDISSKYINMENVELPINIINTFSGADLLKTQHFSLDTFFIKNSGKQSLESQLELYGTGSGDGSGSSIISSSISHIDFGTGYTPIVDGGLLTTRGGTNISLTNGQYINDETYDPVKGIITGWGFNSFIENVDYRVKFLCSSHPTASGCQ